MQHRVTTSWGRRSDTGRHEDLGSAYRAASLRPTEEKAALRAWEGEGGSKARATAPLRILIVDNDMRSADALEVKLHASGYSETRVAYSGAAAVAIAADFQPGMVLLDLGLIDMTGYELAQSLRDRAQTRDLRLIALTSSRDHAAREQAREAGFERYLLKPVASLDLLKLMEMPSQ